MSLLSYTEICELIEQGVIQGAEYKNVNSSSLDIFLGETIIEEAWTPQTKENIISLREKGHMPGNKIENFSQYILAPGEFILAHSKEMFNLPYTVSAEYKLNSSMARMGLEHLNAGWCDAGWHGSVLTLELKNVLSRHRIMLHAGDKIGQLVFFKHTEVPADRSYAFRGRYNGDKTVSGVKGK